MATPRVSSINASDSGYEAIVGKTNELIEGRHKWDFTLVTAAMSPYTVTAADQELVIDAPSGDVAIVLPNVASSTSDGLVLRISVHSLSGHTLTTTVAGGSNINGSASFSHSQYTSKAFSCLNGKWLAY